MVVPETKPGIVDPQVLKSYIVLCFLPSPKKTFIFQYLTLFNSVFSNNLNNDPLLMTSSHCKNESSLY